MLGCRGFSSPAIRRGGSVAPPGQSVACMCCRQVVVKGNACETCLEVISHPDQSRCASGTCYRNPIEPLPEGALISGRGESRRLHSTESMHYLMFPP